MPTAATIFNEHLLCTRSHPRQLGGELGCPHARVSLCRAQPDVVLTIGGLREHLLEVLLVFRLLLRLVQPGNRPGVRRRRIGGASAVSRRRSYSEQRQNVQNELQKQRSNSVVGGTGGWHV